MKHSCSTEIKTGNTASDTGCGKHGKFLSKIAKKLLKFLATYSST